MVALKPSKVMDNLGSIMIATGGPGALTKCPEIIGGRCFPQNHPPVSLLTFYFRLDMRYTYSKTWEVVVTS